jgi:hypothetical protein
VNDYIQTLIYCKYTGNAIAKVWAGQAHLPTRDTMWSRFWDQAEQKGGLNVQLQWSVFPNMYCECTHIPHQDLGLTVRSQDPLVC